MKAIVTQFKGPTNTLPSRVTARAEGVKPYTICFPWGHDNAHRVVAQALADRQGWKGELIQGTLPNGDGVFVFKD